MPSKKARWEIVGVVAAVEPVVVLAVAKLATQMQRRKAELEKRSDGLR